MSERCLIVTDVDNTIYDWVGIWAGAFAAMTRVLAERTGRPVEHWIETARTTHVRRGATECPSLLADFAEAASWPAAVDASRVLPVAAAACREYWDHHLAPYPGLREAFIDLTEQGHVIVAYTEGDVSIAAARLSRLGLAGVIRRVFGRAPLPAAKEPAWCTVGTLRSGQIAVDFIPREDNKPNPVGLRTIISRCGASPQQTVYVGDNLWKDVVMARTLGASAYWAKYGAQRRPEHAALLERVAHWTAADVSTERKTTVESVAPDAVLEAARQLPDAVARRSLTVI